MSKLPQLKKVTEAQKKRPKILLLSDDMSTTSGIATMSKTFVYGTVDQFNWVQLGAAINHTKEGQIIDVSQQVAQETGITDASVKIYPCNGYGDQAKLRKLIEAEKPDAILHFTDPRFWQWLYQMEHEIHNKYNIPICYYAIWDNFPYPIWNKSSYASCDLIMGISKQSHLIHNKVLEHAGVKTFNLQNKPDLAEYKPGDVVTDYVPHGIDSVAYSVIDENHVDYEEYTKFKDQFLDKHKTEFLVFWTNRNIRRKSVSDVILAFKIFVDSLPKSVRKKVGLLLHTKPVDPNGTDLVAVKRMVAPDCNIIFSPGKIPTNHMNYFYNLADVTVNIASNEGFGLSSAESIMAGTPVINNTTGGLQDQMRFVDESGEWFTPNSKVTSNHRGTYKEHGEWAFPIYPSNISIQGSVTTPYIMDDRACAKDLARVLKEVYEIPKDELQRRGKVGREWVLSEESGMSGQQMSAKMANGLQTILDIWKGGKRYEMIKVAEPDAIAESGITL